MTDTDDIAKPWAGDLLQRKDEGAFLTQLITTRYHRASLSGEAFSLVLNVDADWGYGKSYFLKHLGLHLAGKGHIVASIDAWASDYATDPLLPVMAAIEAALKPHLVQKSTRERWQDAKAKLGPIMLAFGGGLLRGAANRLVPGAIEAVGNALNTDVPESASGVLGDGITDSSKAAIDTLLNSFATKSLAEFEQAASSIVEFRQDLSLVLNAARTEDVPMPMFILVDELDRCRPTYAVAMLERIKHLFEIDQVVFIVATNTEQLKYAVGAVYGSKFSAGRYLNRFFDMSYKLAEPNRSGLMSALLTKYPTFRELGAVVPGASAERYLTALFNALDLSTRDIEQCMSLLDVVVSAWPKNELVIGGVLFPLACAQKLGLEGGTLKQLADQLKTMVKNPDWSAPGANHNRGVGDVRVLTVLERTSELVDQGFNALNAMDPQGGLDGWIVDNLFSGRHGKGFGVELYWERLQRAGRVTASDDL